MTETARKIESDTLLENIEHHFRVQAGPGAGKTRWLVEHIKNALHKSTRLTPASRIACISYTNVAVNEIRARLKQSAERVEISTIHSFLYRNVVKPYLHLLKDSVGKPLVKFELLDGHYEHHPSRKKVGDWLKAVKKTFDFHKEWPEVAKCLTKLIWEPNDGTGCWSLKLLPNTARPKYFPTTALDEYKSFYWKDGTIDHEDVLYFAHRILEEHPLIREFLSARFPYIFVDEFQDTNPVQTQVVRWLAESGSVVGVIGDPEQSIYGFQGARRQDFVDFSLPDLRNYQIADNRRSTSPIVRLLNHVRTDQLMQQPLRKIDGALVREVAGEPVRVIVGEAAKTIDHARSCVPSGSELHILARKNDEVARLRTHTGTSFSDAWERFAKADHDRARFFEYLVTAVETGRRKNFTLAVRTLLRGLRVKDGELRKPLRYDRPITELQRRGFAVALLESLITEYENLWDEPVLEMYKRCGCACKGLSVQKITENVEKPSAVFRFTNSTPYAALANTVTLSEETRAVRTMHNAKGAEFVYVLVWLGEGTASRLGHILNADDSDEKERRVTYVALSRVRERLFVSVPELTEAEEDALTKLGLEIQHV